MYNIEPTDMMELYVAIFMFQFKALHPSPSNLYATIGALGVS